MANYAALKAAVAAVIKTNGEQDITGNKFQVQLFNIINTLTEGYQFLGVATPDTEYTAGDANVAFLAATAGTYAAMGGLELAEGEVAVLKYNGTAWSKDTALTGVAFRDGNYPSLISGAAQNLVGRGSVPASFLFRTSGGSADIGTGSAKIAKLEGLSLVWNQLVKNGNFTGISDWSTNGASLSASDNVATITKTSAAGLACYIGQSYAFKAGHIYYFRGTLRSDSGDAIYIAILDSSSAVKVNAATSSAVFADVSLIYTATEDEARYCVRSVNAANIGATFAAKNVFLVDLTAMFGAGKEPSSVAEFEALYLLPYYAYNTGRIIPFAAQKLVTTGLNQWDEEWELGSIDASTGANDPSTTVGRSKNYIPCYPNTTYFYRTILSTWASFRFYDANKRFLDPSTNKGVNKNVTFTTPANAYYMRFVLQNANQPTDICINLSWSGYRNGEYEPYEKHEAVIDPASWKDTSDNYIFPYGGMFSVGSDADFAKPDADGYIRKATQVIDRRAYQAGDESDPTVITDGTYTYFVLPTPVEKTLATPVSAVYYVNDFGTEAWEPENTDSPYTAPCDMDIAYAMNAVDTLRRLPENYISKDSAENLLEALKTAGIISAYTMTYNATTGEYDFTITAPAEE